MGFQLILFDLIGKVVFFLRGEPSLVKCCFQLILFDLIGKVLIEPALQVSLSGCFQLILFDLIGKVLDWSEGFVSSKVSN